MKVINELETYKEKKEFREFENYVKNYVIDLLIEKGYTKLDLEDFTLYLLHAISGAQFLPQGISFGLRVKTYDIAQRESNYDIEWREIYQSKKELHDILKRLVTNLTTRKG